MLYDKEHIYWYNHEQHEFCPVFPLHITKGKTKFKPASENMIFIHECVRTTCAT